MPLSSPTSLVTAAAAIAPGRIEAVAGRGSSTITFSLFDLDERDYDQLYASKLELLLAVNEREQLTWAGPHRRRPLQDALIVPRPEQPLKIWLGSGGSPESVGRAVELGVPLFLGILGGTPQHWAQYGRAYRDAWAQVGHPADAADIAVAVHGFVDEHNRQAKATYLEHELRMFAIGAAEIGRPPMSPPGRQSQLEPGGMVFAGSADEVADRILNLHSLLGHTRQILQMDVGGMQHATYLGAIERLGTEVLPQVRKELS
jgi:alkanesulfonate monooxygenase SsuD/methylene tetrahydromethanopterin reductase-like flavin-dependent oxidoreductase (luciferase family)